MANIRITYARFYPIEKRNIPEELVAWMLSAIGEELPSWEKYFYIHPEKEYLDIVTSSKRVLEFEIFMDEKVLAQFHIWVRISDEGGASDLIGLRSRHYPLLRHSHNNSTLRHYGSDNWNYFSTCLYCSDSFSIHMKQHDEATIKSFTNGNLNDLDLSPSPDNSWRTFVNIRFFSCNYIFLNEPGHGGNPLLQNVCDTLWGDGGNNGIITGDVRFFPLQHFVSFAHHLEENGEFPRFSENVLQVCLWNNGKPVNRWTWNDESRQWEEACSLSWAHCGDSEYLRFLTLYEHGLIPYSAE